MTSQGIAGFIHEDTHTFEINKAQNQSFNKREARLEQRLGVTTPLVRHLSHIELSHSERILFKQKDKEIGVINGDLGTITNISDKGFTAKLDSGKTVFIRNKVYQNFDYGYALTVHKSQGMSINNTHAVIDSNYWDKHLSYVAMTRHKNKLNVYADKDNHPTLDSLKKTLSRHQTKDNVIDWPINYALRLGFNADSLAAKAVNHILGLGKKAKDTFRFVRHFEDHLRNQPLENTPNEFEKVKSNAASHAFAKDKAEENVLSSNLAQSLKKESTLVRDFCGLVDEKQGKSRYTKEKINKEMMKISAKILKDKALTTKLKVKLPGLGKMISLSRERCIKPELGD